MPEQGSVDTAQPRMLVLARESRSMTQVELAEAMTALDGPGGRVSQGYVSRAEAGRLSVTGDRLELYARAVGYPARLLCLTEQEVGAGPGLVHHRRKQAVTATELRRIHSLLNLTRIQVKALLPGAPRPAGAGLPQILVDDYHPPAEVAQRLRAELAVGAGPLESVVTLVEGTGALVACRILVPPVPLESGGESVPVDAVSGCAPGEDPLVLLNAGTPGDRQRFTLAHELGHMIMHPVPHPEQEDQANQFAAELLMPREQILADFHGRVGLPLLLELKRRWRVSMWALLRRARTLGVIGDWQYRTLAVEMSSLGYRTCEPGELAPETPTAVPTLVHWQLRQGRVVGDLAEAACLHPAEFIELYLNTQVAPAMAPTITAPASTAREAAG